MSKNIFTNENISQSRTSFPVPQKYSINSLTSAPSMSTIRSKRHSVSFSNTVQYIWKKDSNQLVYSANTAHYGTNFGEKETTVYMTMLDDYRRRRTSASQATASINKCFQASPLQSLTGSVISTPFRRAEYSSSNTATYCSASRISGSEVMFNPTVYFFGEKKKSSCKHKEGMGSNKMSRKVDSGSSLTKSVRDQTTSSERIGSVSKSVNIKEPDRSGKPESGGCMKPCPATIGTRGDMYAAVSHIQIGPREPCPVHGKEPCQGPKCIANAANAEKVPVRVSTVNNPRRGVFELVIRRMTGAPLARNELMLEWTPPPVRSPCGAPCPTICGPPGPCRPVRCRTVCRIPCKPKSIKRKCRKPCRPKPCRVVPCSPGPCQPCKPCKPCYPPFPFKPNPCTPCASCSPCPPCKPKPCRPCSSCGPCKPCKTNLICPTPRTSIIFKPNFPCKPCKRRSSCSPCGPSPCGVPCYSCFYCSTIPACPTLPSCPPSTCDPCASCDPCEPGPCSTPCKPRKPCGPVSCRRSCCKRKPVCRPRLPPKCRPFKPCKPCKPSPCIPCPPRPCSNPCYRPCATGRRRPRKYSCPPNIKPHKKRISPCHNRIKSCPVVACQSEPEPCANKCSAIPSCSTPRCFKSACSTSCN